MKVSQSETPAQLQTTSVVIQVVSLPLHTWSSLETNGQRTDFIRKALQDKMVSAGEKLPPASTTSQRTADAETSQPAGRSNEGEPSWTSSSDRLTAERFDMGRSGGTLSNSGSLTRCNFTERSPCLCGKPRKFCLIARDKVCF